MKIAVLVSGGVDSSVALKLLVDQGHDCTAFYLKIWLEDELASLGECPWDEDLRYVKAVCEQLHVPLQIINLQKEYWDRVVKYVLREVKAGRTPNPDVLCNEQVKFGAFFDAISPTGLCARDHGSRCAIDPSFEKVATGHYADIEEKDGLFFLRRVKDPVKDQTYFLANLKQAQLERALFPLGNRLKSEVRALAKQWHLPTMDRKDSQGICFLGKIHYDDFLKYYLGEQEGDLVEWETKKVIAKHKGFWYYTPGQRKGIAHHAGPWYVVSKDVQKNIVYISNKYHEQPPRNTFIVTDLNWIAKKPSYDDRLRVKFRHRPGLYKCVIVEQPDGSLHVTIDGDDQGIAPGQFAVFYDEKYCYGCGVIA